MPVAAFKTDVDVNLAIDRDFMSNRVELDGTDAQMDDVQATKRLRFSGHNRRRRIEGIGLIQFRVFEERPLSIVLALASCRWGNVDVLHTLRPVFSHFNDCCCALRDGDETVEGG